MPSQEPKPQNPPMPNQAELFTMVDPGAEIEPAKTAEQIRAELAATIGPAATAANTRRPPYEDRESPSHVDIGWKNKGHGWVNPPQPSADSEKPKPPASPKKDSIAWDIDNPRAYSIGVDPAAKPDVGAVQRIKAAEEERRRAGIVD